MSELAANSSNHSLDSLDVVSILSELQLLIPPLEPFTILTKQQTLLTATSLLADPNLQSFYLKAMHWEHPPEEETVGAEWHDRIRALELLCQGIEYALSCGVPGKVVIDVFATIFANDTFDFLPSRQNGHINPGTNARSLQPLMQLDAAHDHFSLEIVNHAQQRANFSQAVRGVLEGQLHVVADSIPPFLMNKMRHHDHRKGMCFELADGRCIFLLNTFNFDNPTDIDCGLVIQDPALIHVLRDHFAQPIPRNSIVHGDGWDFYQDGVADLNPELPETSSPILGRVITLLKDSQTQEIVWSSKFLPDIEELRVMEKRLREGTLHHVILIAPHKKFASHFYLLSGGNNSFEKATEIATKYPQKVKLILTEERCVHAKIIMINGQRLIIGSHNFNRTLIRSRTTEVMLEFPNMPEMTKNSLTRVLAEEVGLA